MFFLSAVKKARFAIVSLFLMFAAVSQIEIATGYFKKENKEYLMRCTYNPL